MQYKYILFDLDGTLTDPAIGITNSVMYALKKYGIDVADRTELYKFIGPPIWDSFEDYYGFSKDQAKEAVGYYREYFSDKGIFENQVYNGIENLLKKLQDRDKTLIIATSKPEVFAKQILEHFGLINYFTFVVGSNLDGTRVKKDEVIKYALEACRIENLAESIMIGDREHDIIGANKNGIHSMGVLYGYGNRTEFEAAGATFIVETLSDIEKILLGK